MVELEEEERDVCSKKRNIDMAIKNIKRKRALLLKRKQTLPVARHLEYLESVIMLLTESKYYIDRYCD